MNSITLVGRAGRDPEVRYFETGTMVANLSMAVNRRSKDEDPDWFNLEIWGKQAQVAADYVRKGSLIGVIGRVGQQEWADRTTGEKRSKTVVTVERLELLGPKPDHVTPPASPAGPPASPAAAPAPITRAPAVADNEIPF
jgi:single-strand DNA-binding protein